ncbi:MAG: HIT domain-containing protein [Propionibacteriaceae bacterium]|jgi:ATP adenylyltransferase|nr:HIT domain-containing protein [Propionibacteriaceae bacterium]
MDIENAAGFSGVPDGFERLWTPYRMAYIEGGERPKTGAARECPFCLASKGDDVEKLIVYRGELAFAVLNLFPYSPGHLLVCPYRHVADYTDITAGEANEIAALSAQAMRVLRKVSSPAGFNLGINQGQVAGAGIAAHLHQHVVPRWHGDSNFFPIIAQTKAIPQLLGDTRKLLADAWG